MPFVRSNAESASIPLSLNLLLISSSVKNLEWSSVSGKEIRDGAFLGWSFFSYYLTLHLLGFFTQKNLVPFFEVFFDLSLARL